MRGRTLSGIQPQRRTWRRLGLLTLALVACDARPPGPPDPYDPATMDFKSPPARVTTGGRQTGAFAAGAALSMTATLKPLDPAPVKEVRLDVTHKIIEIVPGVKFSAWTFGDQVPGPTIRARVGDTIRFKMTNRSDERVPGVHVSAAPMMHSMDFHAAMVSPQDKYRSIAPGQTIEFEFTLNYSGILFRHSCRSRLEPVSALVPRPLVPDQPWGQIPSILSGHASWRRSGDGDGPGPPLRLGISFGALHGDPGEVAALGTEAEAGGIESLGSLTPR